jgi:hypothetical protein
MPGPKPISSPDRPWLEALLDALDRLYDGSGQASDVRSLCQQALAVKPRLALAPDIEAASVALSSIIAEFRDPAAQAEQALAAVDPLRRLLAAAL